VPEAPTLDTSDAGRFIEADRSIAVAQALPVLASYFADAPTWALSNRAELAKSDPGTDEVAAFVRMRVALALLARLEPILVAIMARPSFYYAREADESVGSLRGSLDLGRYVRTRLRPESPRRYPVRVINRQYATPENAAASYAALWLAHELSEAPLHLLPKGAPEYRSVLTGRAQLRTWLRQPVLLQGEPQARATRRRRELPQLVDTVRQRLTSGRIAAPDRYEALTRWLEATIDAEAGTDPGDIEWSFYDDRFDTKLFELWSLQHLSQALERHLGPPTHSAASLLERSRRPMRVWNLGAVRIQLLFQPSLARVSDSPVRWRFKSPHAGALAGFPDIAIRVFPVAREPFTVLVDPKLRQRSGPPTDELYKVLGYFGNLASQPVRGAIIFYSPGQSRKYELTTDLDEQLLAVGIDLRDNAGTEAGFDAVAELVVQAAGVDRDIVAALASGSDGSEGAADAAATIRQRAAVQAMNAAVGALPDASLAPVRKSVAASLDAIWSRLDHETATMLVTAEYFGTAAPSDADHSGPLLGLAAACERVLVENVFEPAMTARPDLLGSTATLGTLIRWLNDATRQHPRDPEGAYLGRYLHRHSTVDIRALSRLTGDLRRLNVEFRIPAAHRDVVDQGLWAAGRSLILDPTRGLLTRLVLATTVQPPSS
jgi:hypothetical protein